MNEKQLALQNLLTFSRMYGFGLSEGLRHKLADLIDALDKEIYSDAAKLAELAAEEAKHD